MGFTQGSNSMQLRCGDIFIKHLITNFPQNVPVIKFYIRRSYRQKFEAYFLGHPVYHTNVVTFTSF